MRDIDFKFDLPYICKISQTIICIAHGSMTKSTNSAEENQNQQTTNDTDIYFIINNKLNRYIAK